MTIRDVALRAGVSPATVSRVLNRPELVQPETRDRVRQAMQELEFHPSALARGLSVQRTNTIGLVVPGITDLFFNEIYAGIERTSSDHDMQVLLYDSEHSHHRTLEAFTFLKQHEVDGIIYLSRLLGPDVDPILERIGIPVVLALTESTCSTPLAAYKVDDVRAVFDAVSYLVARGHRRIGMISADLEDETTGQHRHEGYLQAVHHFGLPGGEEFVELGDYRFDEGYAAMQRLLMRQDQLQLTAVVTASDEMAIGAMRCLYDKGYRVPDDMSVIGFDDLRIASMVTPRLTTVAQPFGEIGAQAVKHLIGLIQGEQSDNAKPGIYYLPHKIVERESVRRLDDYLGHGKGEI